jgi:hypothetical protein
MKQKQKRSPTHFLPNSRIVKSSSKIQATSVIFKQLLKVNDYPLGESGHPDWFQDTVGTLYRRS